jgi:hypothetical protein
MVKARGPLPLGEARSIVSALASALAAAHAKGIVHRDVHPGNVFIETRTGRAVLSDFGIAGLLDSGSGTTTRLTKIGQQFGDVNYACPEYVRGEALTEQSDVYSLGILGFELATGRRPFEFASLGQMITAHLQQPPPDAQSLRPDLDFQFKRVLERCLAKEPNQRPRASDIPALLERRAGEAAPVGGLSGFLGELKRRRMYQTAFAYVASAFVVVQGANLVVPTFSLVERFYDELVAVTLAGFPVALVLSWIYDVRQGRILRTTDVANVRISRWQKLLPWIGLGFSVLFAGLLWWLLTGS